MLISDVLGVLAVVAFWALVFSVVFYLVRMISVDRDGEQVACALPKPAATGTP
ncbi:MAG: hypothetical protein IVW57_16535 [Ktedonobacterales bacterium]|nr:hypothetical protein [Ktedonobacterales bacterium]